MTHEPRLIDGPWRAQAEITSNWGGSPAMEWHVYSEAPIQCARHVATVTAEREADAIAKLIAAAPEMRDLLLRLYVEINFGLHPDHRERITAILERLGIPTEEQA